MPYFSHATVVEHGFCTPFNRTMDLILAEPTTKYHCFQELATALITMVLTILEKT